MMNAFKILIADDHSLIREGLKHALRDFPIPCTLLEAADATEVRSVLESDSDIGLVVLDLQMPGVHDLELLSDLCNQYPTIPIVVLSSTESPRIIQRCIDRGAAGFIPKCAASEVLASAIQLVLSGGVYIPPEALGKSLQQTSDAGISGDEATVAPRRSTSVRPDFTNRQLDVLKLLSAGKSNKAIANKLGLSEHTVKIHMTGIFKALGVHNRTEAVIAYSEMGLPEQK
jgi:DNA-binding NarL/FixJ family response regulator